MSGRFVSGGTIGAGEGQPHETKDEQRQPPNNSQWETVQKELEEERRQREEQRRRAATGEEKSLYEILQDNKAAKQAAFEEQNRIKNQFRALDEDEADFLDEVREKRRREEEQARKEVEEGLKKFREERKKDDGGEEGDEQEDSWGVGRKRKRVKERGLRGVKRRVSEGENKEDDDKVDEEKDTEEEEKKKKDGEGQASKKPSLGLVDYGSDDSD